MFESLAALLSQLGEMLDLSYLLIGSLGLTLLVAVIAFIRTNRSYEVTALKTVKSFDIYFSKNPQVNNENLVEFNNKMKRVPKTFRTCWQEYMLEREGKPSDYMNSSNCVDEPCKVSGYSNIIATTGILTGVIAAVTFIISLAALEMDEVMRNNQFFYRIFLLPAIILTIGFLVVAILKARQVSSVANLYFRFHGFERGINKFCKTMPPFIDYEILFTEKEIKEGIPVLHEYLEKRKEQEEKEKAEAALNALNLSKFDFNELGMNSSLLLDRAMLECEKFFNVKYDLSEKIRNMLKEMGNYQKNFDEVTREYEKKAQSMRETIKQLNEQINATTIKIEANYMKKRLNEEQQKLQQFDNDYELAAQRFKKQENEMNDQVKAMRDEIERRRKLVEDAMKAEGETYAKKVYVSVNKTVVEENKTELDSMQNQLEAVKTQLTTNQTELSEAKKAYDAMSQEYRTKLAEIASLKSLKEFFASTEFKQSMLGADYVPDVDQATKREEHIRMLNSEMERLQKELSEKSARISSLESKLTSISTVAATSRTTALPARPVTTVTTRPATTAASTMATRPATTATRTVARSGAGTTSSLQTRTTTTSVTTTRPLTSASAVRPGTTTQLRPLPPRPVVRSSSTEDFEEVKIKPKSTDDKK